MGQSRDGHRAESCVVHVVMLPDSTLPLGKSQHNSLISDVSQ